MKIVRRWAMPNKWTFTIKPIAELLYKYDVGNGWADPFCGQSELCEFRNDLNLNNDKAQTHLEAFKFAHTLPGNLSGVVFDPHTH